jgi:acyl dehydratase
MRLIAENYLSGVAALPSPGVNEIRWLRPVYPNQEVTVTAELTEARRSASKPDRGLLMTTMRGGDEDGNDLFQFSAVSFVLCRGVIS